MPELPAAAAKLQKKLSLKKSAEGIYIRQIYKSGGGQRPALTLAYALAAAAAPSRLHRLDCDEVWHFCAGQPLSLYILDGSGFKVKTLGRGQTPVAVMERGAIFGALTKGWCLFTCTCSPGFEEKGLELIPASHTALTALTEPADLALIKALTVADGYGQRDAGFFHGVHYD